VTIFTKARVGRTFLEEVDAPLGDMLRASFEEAWNTNPVAALAREAELREAMEGPLAPLEPVAPGYSTIDLMRNPPRGEPDSAIISAEDARARVAEAGLSLTIPDEGIPERALQILMDRKRAERMRQDAYARGPTGFVPGALRLGVALGASLLDPLNIASGFIPVVGPARYAAMVGRAGSALGRAGVRAGVGVVEGTAGAALIEPIIYNAMRYEQADYDLVDSLLNVALGGALGGGLHVVGGSVLDVVQGRRAAGTPPPSAIQRGIENAAPETREALLRTSVAQMAEGRAVNVESVANLDPVVRAANEGSPSPTRTRPGTDESITRATDGGTEQGVPFVITQAQRQELAALGYSPDAVKNLRPAEAQDILANQRRAANDVPDSAFNGDLEHGLNRTFLSDMHDGSPVPLTNAGFRPDEVDALNKAGLATDGYMSRPQWVAWMDERGRRIAGRSRPRPAAAPVDPRAWSNVVNDAQSAQPSSLADAGASRSADETLKTAQKADSPQGLEAEAQEAFDAVKELADALGNTQTLDALTREADLITQEAESLGKAARALALCQLRRV
jgi:hypothetical protein